MAFASPFANGATPHVKVFCGANDIFEDDVGASSTNTFNDASGGDGVVVTLDVDADGIVTLTRASNMTPGISYFVVVGLPEGATGAELVDPTGPFSDADGILQAYGDDGLTEALTWDGSQWGPNPFVYADDALPEEDFGLFSQLLEGSEIQVTQILQFQPMVQFGAAATSYNCDCDDDFPTETLSGLTRRIIVRLGYAALNVAPPGMTELVQDFLIQAQKLLFRQYKCFRTERWFTWDMPAGQRFFDFGDNNDECNKKLDPRLITWVGVSQGDNNWRELISGINPVRYTSKTTGLSQWFEVRQCIEVWPAMADSTWSLRIKGIFGLLPFASADDVTTIDSEAIFMLALGNAKAHYGQADAGNSISQLRAYIGFLTAGNQPRRRFFPGDRQLPNAVPPKIV